MLKRLNSLIAVLMVVSMLVPSLTSASQMAVADDDVAQEPAPVSVDPQVEPAPGQQTAFEPPTVLDPLPNSEAPIDAPFELTSVIRSCEDQTRFDLEWTATEQITSMDYVLFNSSDNSSTEGFIDGTYGFASPATIWGKPGDTAMSLDVMLESGEEYRYLANASVCGVSEITPKTGQSGTMTSTRDTVFSASEPMNENDFHFGTITVIDPVDGITYDSGSHSLHLDFIDPPFVSYRLSWANLEEGEDHIFTDVPYGQYRLRESTALDSVESPIITVDAANPNPVVEFGAPRMPKGRYFPVWARTSIIGESLPQNAEICVSQLTGDPRFEPFCKRESVSRNYFFPDGEYRFELTGGGASYPDYTETRVIRSSDDLREIELIWPKTDHYQYQGVLFDVELVYDFETRLVNLHELEFFIRDSANKSMEWEFDAYGDIRAELAPGQYSYEWRGKGIYSGGVHFFSVESGEITSIQLSIEMFHNVEIHIFAEGQSFPLGGYTVSIQDLPEYAVYEWNQTGLGSVVAQLPKGTYTFSVRAPRNSNINGKQDLILTVTGSGKYSYQLDWNVAWIDVDLALESVPAEYQPVEVVLSRWSDLDCVEGRSCFSFTSSAESPGSTTLPPNGLYYWRMSFGGTNPPPDVQGQIRVSSDPGYSIHYNDESNYYPVQIRWIETTGAPVEAGASIWLGGRLVAYTDSNGSASFSSLPGDQLITIERKYGNEQQESLNIPIGGTTQTLTFDTDFVPPSFTVAGDFRPGGEITITGVGFRPDPYVNVGFDGTVFGGWGTSAKPDENGAFVHKVTISPYALPGPHWISTEVNGDEIKTWHMIPEIWGPSLSLSKTSGPPGSTVTVTGTGFGPDQMVKLTSESPYTVLGEVRATAEGTFTFDVRVPSNAPTGPFQIWVRSDFRTMDIDFEVTEIKTGTVTVTGDLPVNISTAQLINQSSPEPLEANRIGQGAFAFEDVPYGEYQLVLLSGEEIAYEHSDLIVIGEDSEDVVINIALASAVLSLTSGQAGSVTEISGSGFESGETVTLRWNTEDGEILGAVSAEEDGTFSGRITIPPTASTGSFNIHAVGESGQSANASYDVTLLADVVVNLSINSGRAGSITAIMGSGFQPGERVTIRWGSANGTTLGWVTASPSGTISGKVTIPPTANKRTYAIIATGGTSDQVGATPYTVTILAKVNVNLSIKSGRAGTITTVMGNGFQPGETVTIRWGGTTGRILGVVKASPNGTVVGRITIPATALRKNHAVVVSGTSGQMGVTPYTVTSLAAVRVNLSLTSGRAGTVTAVMGSGFQPGESVTIRWGSANGRILGIVKASPSGTIGGKITIPTNSDARAYLIYVRAPSGQSGTARYVVSATAAQPIVRNDALAWSNHTYII